jgi:transaldolase
MKIFIASANLEDIRWAAHRRLIDGVLTTHALVGAEEPDDVREHLSQICRASTGPVLVTVHALTSAEVYRDARELAKLSDNVVVQIPFVEDVVDAIHRLSADGVRVAATLVFSAAQALLAARAGARAVVLPMDDLEAAGRDAGAVLRELRSVLDGSGSEADVIALNPRTASQFGACAAAGADGTAVTADVLRELLVHPLTDRGIDRFLRELSQRHAAWTVV